MRRRRPFTSAHWLASSPASSSRCSAGYTVPSGKSNAPLLRSRSAEMIAYPCPGPAASTDSSSRSRLPFSRSRFIPWKSMPRITRRKQPGRHLAGVRGAEVVRVPGAEPRPLGDGAPGRPLRHWWPVGRARAGPGVGAVLWPASGGVFPALLAPVHGEVHERVAVVHGLDAADGRPVRLEHAAAVPQVAHEVHPVGLPPGQQRAGGVLRGVPRHVPAHEVVVTDALAKGALAEDGVRDVAGM